MGLEEIVTPAPEVVNRIGATNSIQLADSPAPVDQVKQGLRYHFSQWTMPSSGIRLAGWNSPPVLKPMASSAACVYLS